MIETVINLSGEREKFDAKKLNHWVQDTVGGINVQEWSEIALEAVKDMPKEVTVHQLIQKLIDTLLSRDTWSHYVMAGRLLAIVIRIEVFGSKDIPTVREVQTRLHEAKLMRKLDYTEFEWNVIEKTINHDMDFTVPHFALEQIRYKYSLQDYAGKKEFETQQFVYIRMAMALFESYPATDPDLYTYNGFSADAAPGDRTRLEHVIRIYRHFANKKLSAPTPNYNNLGTYHKGYASCCLIAVGDSRWSLAAGDHITYMMTTQSAGIGINMMTRSLGDPVQKGRFLHRGKLPYIATFGKNIRANLQGGRGGAGTSYYNLFDPEAKVVAGLRDTRAVDTARNRDAHYAYMSNRFFTMKAAKGEMVATWNCQTAPELHATFYGPDIKAFTDAYARYEADTSIKKEYVSAREILLHSLNQGVSTGTIYAASIDEMNRNTPFIDPIHSSNLCVAPGTIIYVKGHGEAVISEYKDRSVEVWNGFEWSRVTIRRTSEREKLLRVYVNVGVGYLDCTSYHKWYIKDEAGQEKEVRTHELKQGDLIVDYYSPGGVGYQEIMIQDIEDMGVENSTYCFNEPLRHRAVFNGILTGNCLEVSEPSQPYDGKDAMKDLYSSEEVGHALFKVAPEGKEDDPEFIMTYKAKASDVMRGPNTKIVAQHVKVGDQLYIDQRGLGISSGSSDIVVKVIEVVSIKKEPEVALCSLAAVNVTDGLTDEEYRDVMYYSYKMIDYCILENEYILPHMGVTAKARMNAGVGLMGVATHMARRKLKYSSKEGLEEFHRVCERHLYFAIEASIEISKERGLAPWIDRTKWPEGWTPLKTYRREVDDLADFEYQYDWDAVSEKIKANGGLAHSCLINLMPGESSSKALGAVNSIYGIRKLIMIKVDAGNILRWAAPYGDNPEYEYQSMWDTELTEQNSIYAVAQKFDDQSISADWYINFTNKTTISSTELLEAELDRVKKGVKTRYYMNTLMPADKNSMKISESAHGPVTKELVYDKDGVVVGVQGASNGGGIHWDNMAAEAARLGGPVHDGQALSSSDPDLAALGITFQTENTGGDGHLDCVGCSV